MTPSRNMQMIYAAATALLACVLGGGCTRHTVKIEPITVEPITLNINLRVERELEDAFDFEDRIEAQVEEEEAVGIPPGIPPAPTTQPGGSR